MSWFSKKSDAPSLAWMEEAAKESQFTPDLSQLMKSQFQLLFIYDRMMRGFPDYGKVDTHSVYQATAYTEGKFSMIKRELGGESYPVAFDQMIRLKDWEILDIVMQDTVREIARLHSHVPRPQLVKGQLHAVRPYHFLELDKLMQNGVIFQRKRVKLITPYRKKVGNIVQPGDFTVENSAWMYIGVPDYWRPLLTQPSQYSKVQVFQSRKEFLDPYYYFSKLEINDQQTDIAQPVSRVSEERIRHVRGQFRQLRRRTLILLRLRILSFREWWRAKFRRR
jgi:hypothetical protein